MSMSIGELCRRYKPCKESRDWLMEAGYWDAAEAWEDQDIPGEWLCWCICREGIHDPQATREFYEVCCCATNDTITDSPIYLVAWDAAQRAAGVVGWALLGQMARQWGNPFRRGE